MNKVTFREILAKLAAEEDAEGKNALERLGRVVWEKALNGDRFFTGILLDRLEGRVVDAVPMGDVVKLDEVIAYSLETIYGPLTPQEVQKAIEMEAEMDHLTAMVGDGYATG